MTSPDWSSVWAAQRSASELGRTVSLSLCRRYGLGGYSWPTEGFAQAQAEASAKANSPRRRKWEINLNRRLWSRRRCCRCRRQSFVETKPRLGWIYNASSLQDDRPTDRNPFVLFFTGPSEFSSSLISWLSSASLLSCLFSSRLGAATTTKATNAAA